MSYDTGSNTLRLTADDVRFPALTATDVRYAVFFVDTGVPGTSPLLCYVDFGVDVDRASQDFLVVMPATGLIQSVAA